MDLTFRSLKEGAPKTAWKQVFNTGWPGWQAWLRARQTPDAPSLRDSETALHTHMPEFSPIWETLVKTADADEEAARFLTFWTPPRYLGQCAQAVSGGDEPSLVRNYDLDPRLNEATLLKSEWIQPVIGMVEGLSGLADGINGSGLAVSLAYGGRRTVGEGFGVPLVVRYLLETCETVENAVETLQRLPHHMSYNLTLLDRTGAHATAMIASDRDIIVSEQRFITNHQISVEDERHAVFCNTIGRFNYLNSISLSTLNRSDVVRAFQAAPLYNTQFEVGFGTVYTAAYSPLRGEAKLIWPGQEEWTMSFDDFREETRTISFTESVDALENEPDWMRFVPTEARRYILLGVENAA